MRPPPKEGHVGASALPLLYQIHCAAFKLWGRQLTMISTCKRFFGAIIYFFLSPVKKHCLKCKYIGRCTIKKGVLHHARHKQTIHWNLCKVKVDYGFTVIHQGFCRQFELDRISVVKNQLETVTVFYSSNISAYLWIALLNPLDEFPPAAGMAVASIALMLDAVFGIFE